MEVWRPGGSHRQREQQPSYDSIGALGREGPDDLVSKALARIKRQMGDAQGGN